MEATMESPKRIRKIGSALWDTGDFYGRIFILLSFLIPLIFCGMSVATTSIGTKATISFFLLLGLFLLGALKSPVFIGLLSIPEPGESFLKWMLTILSVEIAVAVAFAVLDFTKYPGLAPLGLLAVAGLVTINTGKKKIKYAGTLLWIVLGVIIYLTLLPWKLEGGKTDDVNRGASSMEYKLQDRHMVEYPQGVQPVSTETFKKVSKNGAYTTIETNCVDFMIGMTRVQPGEKVKIMHMNMAPAVRRNRCAYSLDGSAASITGKRGSREGTLPGISNNLPFPEFPAGVVVFVLAGMNNTIIAKDYIKDDGKFIVLEHIGMTEGVVSGVYNTPPQFKNQVGVYGDTATISLAILN